MTFLRLVLSLVASMRPFWGYALNYIFGLAFLASVPCVIRQLWRR